MRVPPLLNTLISTAGFTSLADWSRAAGVGEKTLHSYRRRGLRPGASVMRRLMAVTKNPIDPDAFAEALLQRKEKKQ